MLERAKKHLEEHTVEARNWDEFKAHIEKQDGFVKAMWCGETECEEAIKDETTATTRCMPFEQEHLSDVCVHCGKPAKKMEKLTKSIMITIAGDYEDTFPAILPFARYICKNSK